MADRGQVLLHRCGEGGGEGGREGACQGRLCRPQRYLLLPSAVFSHLERFARCSPLPLGPGLDLVVASAVGCFVYAKEGSSMELAETIIIYIFSCAWQNICLTKKLDRT